MDFLVRAAESDGRKRWGLSTHPVLQRLCLPPWLLASEC